MVEDNRCYKRVNLFPPLHGQLFDMHHPTDRIAHNTVFVTPVVEH